ncbi:unnamed protein product [Blepharisma stoltei]|uniref:Uncharacterized protein n=1 Tax=Blepharisma stoltei TaxID=1481888 RepID=A0AAU9K554_9CILI|nr:unnamed protein product [Blepharisma stoltei]
MNRVPLLSTRKLVLEALDRSSVTRFPIKAMYNSLLGGIINDHALMSIPIDDHMAHRGHSVFDTLSVINGRAFILQSHLDRLLKSASQARIELPFERQKIAEILKQLAASTGLQCCKIRYWLSTGPGSIEVFPLPGMSAFYAIAFEGDARAGNTDIQKEFTSSVPLKPKLLATMKSTNYLLNALCAMESQDQGGHFGIMVNEAGFIAEGPVANLSFILPGRRFVTPPYDDILRGTTSLCVVNNAKELLNKGILASVEQRNIHIDEAKTCEEMFYSSGDTIHPVLEWDGKKIGSGVRGPISQLFIDAHLRNFENPALCEEIPYNLYKNDL